MHGLIHMAAVVAISIILSNLGADFTTYEFWFVMLLVIVIFANAINWKN